MSSDSLFTIAVGAISFAALLFILAKRQNKQTKDVLLCIRALQKQQQVRDVDLASISKDATNHRFLLDALAKNVGEFSLSMSDVLGDSAEQQQAQLQGIETLIRENLHQHPLRQRNKKDTLPATLQIGNEIVSVTLATGTDPYLEEGD